ncbi:emerin [Pimephales promelas]|nr:emerin [Pimephales promelas]KAG1961876.1 emerin [Pimephales promelas]KAG1961877.1 emerin [Pimephales promelas]KAG1961878.1 emerin [Pimephales promelas]
MSTLSGKSDKEISQLLDEYGIKHGPVVESTRKLYEKKLKEAMAKNTKPSSSDKTYYREEQDEVEYLTFHQPPPLTRYDAFGDVQVSFYYILLNMFSSNNLIIMSNFCKIVVLRFQILTLFHAYSNCIIVISPQHKKVKSPRCRFYSRHKEVKVY